MRIILAVIVAIALVAFGVYVDIFWLLVPGIVQIIHAAQAHPVNATLVAWGVVKILASGIATTIAFILAFFVVTATAATVD